MPSGGTLASYLSLLDIYSISEVKEAADPWALSPIPGHGHRMASGTLGVRTVPEFGTLAFFINEAPDRAFVYRSWALHDGGEYYGRKFRFSEGLRVTNIFIGLLSNLAFMLGILMILLPPVR